MGNRERVGKWLLSVLLWVWTGTLYFFIEVVWKTSHGRPEMISWTMLLLAIILAVPLERFGAELPWEMPLMAQSAVCGVAITVVEFVAGLVINGCVGLLRHDWEHHGAGVPAVPGHVGVSRSGRHCDAGLDAVWGGRRRETALHTL